MSGLLWKEDKKSFTTNPYFQHIFFSNLQTTFHQKLQNFSILNNQTLIIPFYPEFLIADTYAIFHKKEK